MTLEIYGVENLERTLDSIDGRALDAVMERNMRDVYERGKSAGGTPVDTGQLRSSLEMSKDSDGYSVGYSAQYAPDVEYGHRTKNGKFVKGQHFLRDNVAIQEARLLDSFNEVFKRGGLV